MKLVSIVTLAFVLIGSSSFAASTKSTSAELHLLCSAVEKNLAGMDDSFDLNKCLVNETVITTLGSEGTFFVNGNLDFNGPERSFKLNCEISYNGTPKLGNIQGGFESGVSCQ